MGNSARLGGLDYLRFLAALVVLLNHYTNSFILGREPDGWVSAAQPVALYGGFGVHAFFVISGFVIAMSATVASTRGFIAGRIARLLPTFAVCAAITWIFLLWAGEGVSLLDYLLNLTFFPHKFGSSYIDGVYWTLTHEVWFYGLVALTIAVGASRHLLMVMSAWLGLCALYTMGIKPDFLAANFYTNYAPLFIVGVGLNAVWQRRSIFGGIVMVAALALALINQLEYARLWMGGTLSMSVGMTVVMIMIAMPAVVLLAATIRIGGPAARALGALSYPLYLLHANVGRVVFHEIPQLAGWHGVALVAALMIVASHYLARADSQVRPQVRRTVAGMLDFGFARWKARA